MIFPRILSFHFFHIFNIKNIVLIILISSINTIISYYTYNLFETNLLEALVKIYYLPINLTIDTLKWILIIVTPLIGIGTFINHQLYENSIYILISMKNFYYWFNSVTIISFIHTFVTLIISFITSLILLFFFTQNHNLFSRVDFYKLDSYYLNLLFHEFCLIFLSVFLLILIYILLIFLTRNQSVAILILILIVTISITVIPLNTIIIKLNPLTLGLIGLRELVFYPLSWSYFYLVLSIIIMYVLTLFVYKIHKETIFNNNNY